MDEDFRNLAFGVQWELARGQSLGLWKWEDVTPSLLNQLKGSNAEAVPKVARVMLEGRTGTSASESENLEAFHGSHLIWYEYDREQAALIEGEGRGLGLMGEYRGVDDWYGGRIQQIVRLVKEDKGKGKGKGRGKKEDATYKWVLDQPEMKRSNRFARFLGSRRVLEIKVPKGERYQLGDKLLEMLAKRFVLLGRVYIPIDAKDDKVYLVEVNDDFERTPKEAQGDSSRLSYQQFINWHNPLSRNSGQPIAKWTTRFDLGLSTSVPVLKFKPENVHFIEDIEVRLDPHEKVPAERCMTDGCGFMNRAALIEIAKALKLPGPPPAVQGRGMGCKGLWTLHPDPNVNTHPEPAIWHRASQHKIQLGDLDKCSPAHLIFDLVAPARVTCPGRLSMQLIMNMSHNGVPDHVFQTLLRESLEEEVSPLMRWTGPHVRPALWAAVMRAGNVMGMRLQRLAGATARAQGLARRFEMADSDDEGDADIGDIDEAFLQAPAQTSAGPPDSLYEVVLQLIESGFLPESSEYLNTKLRQVLKNVIESFVAKYHIVVPCSAEVFCIPDPLGVLKPGEIHFRSTRELRDSDTGLIIDTITGPVLISRNPTRVASDVQKVNAIQHPLLADYKDVVVFSTQGDRSQASKGGGGDTFLIIWYRPLVSAFTTPELVLPESDFMEKNFRRSVVRVPDFCAELRTLDRPSAHKMFVQTLMGSLHDRMVGFYSQCHDNAVYAFCVCLDSNKSGYRLIEEVRKKDSLAYKRDRPDCMVDKSKPEPNSANNKLTRKSTIPFVLDQLLKTGQDLEDRFLVQFESLRKDEAGKSRPWPSDLDLDGLYNKALALAPNNQPAWKKELDCFEKHILSLKSAYDQVFHRSSVGGVVSNDSRKDKDKTVKMLAMRFLQRPANAPAQSLIIPLESPQQRADLRASCAYHLTTKGSSKKASFAFAMAFRDLCRMKAMANGHSGARTILTEIADLLTMPGSAVRLLAPPLTTSIGGL
ncbi:RNA dependent RNA polymerase-domain-containing protein [Amylostereum chailletii]|nr:RNA dependent RNA polymerase-domain-containing protein [Amylostereum chailletii]